MSNRIFKTIMKVPVDTIPYKCGERYMACTLEVVNGRLELKCDGTSKYFKTAAEANDFMNKNPVYESGRAVEIRFNFDEAFKKVTKGYELSGILGYGFSKEDISNLAKLHRDEKWRNKIIELLEDCNFHIECDDFDSGKYDKYIIE